MQPSNLPLNNGILLFYPSFKLGLGNGNQKQVKHWAHGERTMGGHEACAMRYCPYNAIVDQWMTLTLQLYLSIYPPPFFPLFCKSLFYKSKII